MKKQLSFKLKLMLSFLFFPLIFIFLFAYFFYINDNFYKQEIVREINRTHIEVVRQFLTTINNKFDQIDILIEPAQIYTQLYNKGKFNTFFKEKGKIITTTLFRIQSKSKFFKEIVLVNNVGQELIKFIDISKADKKDLLNIKNTQYFKGIQNYGLNKKGVITLYNKNNGIEIFIYNYVDSLYYNSPFIIIGKVDLLEIKNLVNNIYLNEKKIYKYSAIEMKAFISIYDADNRNLITQVPEKKDTDKKRISQSFIIPITNWNLNIAINVDYPHFPFFQKDSLFLYIFIITFLIILITAVFLYTILSFDIKLLMRSINLKSTKEKDILLKDLKNKEFYTIAFKYNDLIKKLTDQAQLAAIGKSTAMVAHDVRKPLSSMKALLNILPQIKDDPAKIRQAMTDVDTKISNTNEMLNEILAFSKDAKSLDLKKHNPQSIITSSLSDALRTKNDINIKIEYDLKHKNYLNVDSNRIIRVFTNIICNAIEAMDGLGKIWFKTYDQLIENKTQTVIVIGDDGPIIPEDVQKKLFEPFFTKGKKDGTGLGLAICQKIVKMHGGDIEIVSNKENATEFLISLPALIGDLKIKEGELIYSSDELLQFRQEETKRIEYGDTSNTTEFLRLHKQKGKELCLLVLDDDSLFRETIKTLLSSISQVRDHVKVIESDNAKHALNIFEQQHIDYVISDIDLGKDKMNGYEFTKTILKKYPETYIVINSNKRREEMDGDIREVACPYFMGFLPKPMKQSELLQFLACKTFEIETSDKKVSKEIQKNEVKKQTALILNDDDIILLSFKMSLKKYNLNILLAKSVKEAKEAFKSNKINFILSDINLGEGQPDGYDFLEWVRDQNRDLPIYMVSGYSEIMERPIALQKGATGYLQLPVEEDQIVEIIKSCQGAVGSCQEEEKKIRSQSAEVSGQKDSNLAFDNIDEILKKVVHDINNTSSKLVDLLQADKNIDNEEKGYLLESLEEIKTVTKKFNVKRSDFENDEEMYQTIRKAVHDINNPLATLSLVIRNFDEEEVKNKSLMISCLKSMGDTVRTLPKQN